MTHKQGNRYRRPASRAIPALSRLSGPLCCLLVAGCAQQAVVDQDMMQIEGGMPADFGGNWERDYSRGDDVDAVLRQVYRQLARTNQDQRPAGIPAVATPNPRDMSAVLPLARLAELITRPDVLYITQDEYRIRVDRKDDYSLECSFFDGVARATDSGYGVEICGWDGNELVSNLVLPDGLQVTYRFAISEDAKALRMVTTLDSPTSRLPFTLRRFYRKFEYPPGALNCIETLSMKRVCSTAEIEP